MDARLNYPPSRWTLRRSTLESTTCSVEVCAVSASTLLLGVSQATATLLKAGACTLVAQQAGDATFNPAAPVTRTFNISARLFLPLLVR